MISRDTALFTELSRELLARGQRVRFRAEGGSMHPAIRGGEAITVEAVQPSDVVVGEVLLYEGDQRRVTVHRVTRIEGMNFEVRGDAPGSLAERISAAQILGRVISVERTSVLARIARRVFFLGAPRAIAQ